MAVTKAPVKFQTEDGRKFDTEEEAKRHEKLATARDAFWAARKTLGRLLAETQRTADGEAFTFDFHTYYFVTESWSGMPDVREISFCRYDFDFDDTDVFRVIVCDNDAKHREYRITDLYANRSTADRALLVAQQKRLEELGKLVAETRARVRHTERKASAVVAKMGPGGRKP